MGVWGEREREGERKILRNKNKGQFGKPLRLLASHGKKMGRISFKIIDSFVPITSEIEPGMEHSMPHLSHWAHWIRKIVLYGIQHCLAQDSFFYCLQASEASWSVALWSEEHLSVMFFPELQDAPSGVDAINSIRFPREVNFMVHGVWWRTLVCQKLSTKGLPLKKQPLGNI